MLNKETIMIQPLTPSTIAVVNDANDTFPVIGYVSPRFVEGKWSYEEHLLEISQTTRFPDDQLDWTKYIEKEDRIVFLAFSGDSCIGQIRLVRDWNRFAYIENIAVKQAFRKHGVGHRLLAAATTWAKERNLVGLSLEAQHDNLIACRFYARQGFVLGGVDTLKQYANPQIGLTLYWYKIF
ncbi:GCN5 family acetyltransferase [Exiguobacterium sp. BMC-KP]|uniref:GNAT family N-acetyltransferase n=1 Tax=Exiguobacterium sp. BMC-KP TaxID=1684312 RepID=UPI0006AA373C|nr:GNAT family N-acetyltransferase [Exiguobacterium sp. BMC-KP]KOP29087.1 GCN5 family acetyltransferase [Exiguobacterium sp. BMC-KP]